MNIYYKNHLKKHAELIIAPIDPNTVISDLYDVWLERSIEFTENAGSIHVSFPLNIFVDSLCFIACNFTGAHIVIRDFDGDIVFEGDCFTQGRHTAFDLPDKYMASSVDIALYGADENLTIGNLFVGERLTLPRFTVNPSFEIDIRSKAELTRGGQWYGIKTPPLASFSASFAHIDNEARLALIEYIDAVENITPHLVKPYDTGKFEALYGVLTDGGKFTKRQNNGFWWDTSLSWKECK
jgi:hypothetical protein